MANILVVDDEKSIRITLGSFLADEGYEVSLAEDVQEAKALIGGQHFDVILTDIILPRITGVELLRILSADSPNTLAIMMTGEPTVSTATESVRLGAFDYLVKPISKERVLQAVSNAMRVSKLNAEKARLLEQNREYQGNLEYLVAKKTEALLESEAKYRDLYDNAPDMYVSVDAATARIIRCNQTLQTVLGYSEEEIIGIEIFELHHESCIQEVRKVYEQFISTGEVRGTDLQLKLKDGSPLDVSLNISAVRDPDGNVLHCRSVWRDITKRKQAEKRLRENEEQFRTVINSSSDAFVIIDRRSRITWFNPAAEVMFGIDATEAIGKSPEFMMPASYKKTHADSVASYFATGKPNSLIGRTVELSGIRSSGEEFPLELSLSRGTHTQQELVLGIIRDISERVKAEVALKESEQRYRLLADNATDVIWEADLSGRQIYNSPSIERQMGYTVEEARNHTVFTTLSPASAELVKQTLTEELATDGEPGVNPNTSRTLELEQIHKNGSIVWIEVKASFIRDADGNPISITGVTRDITDRKIAEQKLRVTHSELVAIHEQLKKQQQQLIQSEKMASLGTMAAGVAHEINNPVGYVMSNLGTLSRYVRALLRLLTEYSRLDAAMQNGTADDPQAISACIQQLREEEDLEYILEDIGQLLTESQEGAERVRDIVNDLRSYAHATEKNRELADVNEAIESALKIVWNELKYKCEVHKQLKQLPPLMCQLGEFQQVFANLLVNASHAIVERGEITIESEATEQEIVIRFSDTGEGISAENITKVFDPFFTTKEVGKGTGLGLSISHAIIARHGGWMDVESEIGKGTLIVIHLPLEGAQDG